MSSAAFKLFQRCLADIQAADKCAVKKAKKYFFLFFFFSEQIVQSNESFRFVF